MNASTKSQHLRQLRAELSLLTRQAKKAEHAAKASDKNTERLFEIHGRIVTKRLQKLAEIVQTENGEAWEAERLLCCGGDHHGQA